MIAVEKCHRPVTEQLADGTGTKALPLSASPMSGSSAGADTAAQSTILLVEDDDILRRLIQLILKTSGFDVLEAGRGLEALRVSRAYGGAIHLLITDLVLPELDGQNVADRLQDQRPGLRVLFISGHADEIAPRAGAVNFLQKPFTPGAFLQSVNRILQG